MTQSIISVLTSSLDSPVISISIKDFGLTLLWAMLIVCLFFLIRMFFNAFLILREIRLVVKENRDSIDETLKNVPGLVKNVEDISGEISHGAQVFRPSVDNVAETSKNVTNVLKENNSAMESLGSVLQTVAVGKAMYDKFIGKKPQSQSETAPEEE